MGSTRLTLASLFGGSVDLSPPNGAAAAATPNSTSSKLLRDLLPKISIVVLALDGVCVCHQVRLYLFNIRSCTSSQASPLRLRSCLKIPISGARQAGVPAFLIVLGCCLFGVLLHRAWLLPLRRASSAAVLAAYTSAFTLEPCRASHPRESACWRSASRRR